MDATPNEMEQYLPPRNFLEKVLEWANRHCPSIVNAIFNHAWAFKTNSSKVPIGGNGGVTIISIGNSHIDAAWLWRKQDTINKKIPVTFARALNHFELHPLFTYSQNQAVYYKWVKESYPALFSLIKERIADGRWDYAGGDWVESDVNLPSGESLVRQRLHGQRFYLAEFGAVADVAWDDDVFGFPWSLPQILMKSGAKYWWTNKFGYNDTNFFPLTTWRWRGVDGTEILAHWSVHKNNFNKMLARMHYTARLCPPGKEIVLNTQTDWDTVSTEFSLEIAPVLANFYGNGDGGHGPTPMEILEQLTWARKGLVTLGTTKLLWNLLEPYRSRVPVWADELYLERHRGTLTSIHMIKENNRTAEILLQAVECIGVLGTLAGGSSLQAKIAQVWETVLFNQFHDVLPGSSIIEVYQDCGEEYKSLYAEMIPLAQETVSAIVSKSSEVSNELGNILQSYALANTVCWDRAGYFVIPRPLGEEHRIYLDNGKELGWQPITCSPWLPNRDIGLGATDPTGYQYMATIDGTRELVENSEVSLKYALIYLPPGEVVPAFGLRSIVVCEGAPAIPDPRVKLTDVPEEVILSNEMVEARISKQSGRVIYLGMPGDSEANLLREPGAGIQMYRDPDTEFPAWDIAADCFSRPILSPPVREVVPTEVGPLRAACVVKHALTSKGSEIWIFYSLQAGDAKLYCEVWANWQEEETFLKFDVPTTLDPANVQCEQPYAWIRRPTRPQTSMERARWEFASQMWADFEDSAFPGGFQGILLLNQCSYGLSTGPRYLGLSLLKSARFTKPDREATLTYPTPRPKFIDRGFHRIPLALLPHALWSNAEVKNRIAWEYNAPLPAIAVSNPVNVDSLVHLEADSTEITYVKLAEPPANGAEGDFYLPAEGEIPLILRLVEHAGTSDDLRISIAGQCNLVREVDLLERLNGEDIAATVNIVDGHVVEVNMRPFEIKTLLCVILKQE